MDELAKIFVALMVLAVSVAPGVLLLWVLFGGGV